jgi:nitroreductase
MDVLKAIRTKRAVRQFSSQPVPEDIMENILHAGRRSQSSKNSQPWQFVVVRERNKLAELATCGTYAGHLAGAAFAVVLVSEVEWSFDIGQTAAYMQLAGWSQGVSSCIATLQDAACARSLLGVPADRFVEIALSFGYAAEAAKPPKRGARRTLQDVVHWENW